jgi:glycosyltransferase involved in cell wall biosynthesis
MANKNPLLQILIITYNQLKYCERLISNVRSYASEEVPVIIQDDCSIDGTAARLRSGLSDLPHVTVRCNPSNVGAVKNSASLIASATAEYIVNLGGDDLFIAESLVELLSLLKTNNYDLVVGRCLVRSEMGESTAPTPSVVRNVEAMRYLADPRNKENSTAVLRAAAEIPGFLWCQAIAFRTRLLKNTQLIVNSDVDDWGSLHNIAVHSKSAHVKLGVCETDISLVSINPNSRGGQITKQLERQINAVVKYWHPDFKKAALLNVVEKKLKQFRDPSFSADDIINGLSNAFQTRSDKM